jgi:hypothetical protein
VSAKFISFDNGVCRHLSERQPQKQLIEAAQACETVQLGANLVDAELRVVGHVRRSATAHRGWSAYFINPA